MNFMIDLERESEKLIKAAKERTDLSASDFIACP